MATLFSQLISQLNSSVFVLLGILFLFGWFLFKIGGWKERFSNQDKRLQKVEDIHVKVIELSTKVNLIYQHTNPHSVVSSHSSLGLTEFGKALANEINAKCIFEKYYNYMISELNAICVPDTNAYDIQTTAMDIVKNNLVKKLDAEEINLLKQTAFEKGMLFEDILPLFGIYLRDRALKERNIPVLEVDENDPTRT